MLVNLHLLPVNSYSFFKDKLAISNLQKKIAIITVILLGCLLIGCIAKHFFWQTKKVKKIEKRVDLYYRKITSTDLDQLPSDLHSLDLCEADLTEIVDLHKKLPPVLKSLNLSDIDLKKVDLKKLPEGLESLNLSGTLLTDLRGLPSSLRSLNLNCCYTVTSTMLGQLPRNLKVLILGSCRLEEPFFDFLPPNLTGLGLSDRRLLPEDMEKLKQLPLTSLDVSGWDLTDKEVDDLPQTVVDLNLSYNKKITGIGLAKLKLFMHLKSLKLRGHPNLSDTDVGQLPDFLRKLDLCVCKNLTPAVVEKLPRALSSLTFIANGFELTDECLKKLPPNLTSLFSSRKFNNKEDVAKLPKGIKKLNGMTDPIGYFQN